MPDRYIGFDDDISDYPAYARDHGVKSLLDVPNLADGLRGLEQTRCIDLEDWMEHFGLDCVVFPAVADVGRADADTNPDAADHAWQNGVWVANGNLAIRHFGIPTVTVPMGVMTDTAMPVGLTFAGRTNTDNDLLAYASAFDSAGNHRTAPDLEY